MVCSRSTLLVKQAGRQGEEADCHEGSLSARSVSHCERRTRSGRAAGVVQLQFGDLII